MEAHELNHTSTLDEWVEYILSKSSKAMNLNLDHVNTVWERCNINKVAPIVITIAGTNGKGSTTRILEVLFEQLGFKTLVYSSPHFVDYRERIRINQKEVLDSKQTLALSVIDKAAFNTTLTYFEYSTLSALWLAYTENVDICLLEVGMGGRLDATNIVKSDMAIITNVDLDHVKHLGSTRELIGAEKAGIARYGRPLIFGDPRPLKSVNEIAERLNTPYYRAGIEYSIVREEDGGYTWRFENQQLYIPTINLAPANVANALTALAVFNQKYLPKMLEFKRLNNRNLSPEVIRHILGSLRIPGRYQTLSKEFLNRYQQIPDLDTLKPIHVIIDVAHNPNSTGLLAQNLEETRHKLIQESNDPHYAPKIYAIFSMLHDKEASASIQNLLNTIDHWYIVNIESASASRASTAAKIVEHFFDLDPRDYEEFDLTSLETFIHFLKQQKYNPGDIVVIFGSFYVISDFMLGLGISYNDLANI